jgi:uncharacterized protein (DUF58 family)
LRGVGVKRLLPDAAHAGEPFALRYEVSREKGHAFALSLSELGGGLSGSAFVPIVRPGETVRVRAQMTAERRGPHPLAEVEVSTTFPFGIFLKTRRVELEDLLLVFPRRGFACVEPPEHSGAPAGDGGDPRRRDGNGDLLGLRELNDGEDARRVHWLKSATAGKLLKVEREREERRQFMLTVNDALIGEALDRAHRAGARGGLERRRTQNSPRRRGRPRAAHADGARVGRVRRAREGSRDMRRPASTPAGCAPRSAALGAHLPAERVT